MTIVTFINLNMSLSYIQVYEYEKANYPPNLQTNCRAD
jgi:hypothetical protein